MQYNADADQTWKTSWTNLLADGSISPRPIFMFYTTLFIAPRWAVNTRKVAAVGHSAPNGTGLFLRELKSESSTFRAQNKNLDVWKLVVVEIRIVG